MIWHDGHTRRATIVGQQDDASPTMPYGLHHNGVARAILKHELARPGAERSPWPTPAHCRVEVVIELEDSWDGEVVIDDAMYPLTEMEVY